nr:hypothetical protein [Tanacetum cinerariifolium]
LSLLGDRGGVCVEFGCHFEVERECEFTLSSLDVLQRISFFLQMGLTLILATFDGLDVCLLGDVIGEDDSMMMAENVFIVEERFKLGRMNI